jgi:hypothetical protein
VAKALMARARSRFPTAPIVMGGEHPTAVPEFCLTRIIREAADFGWCAG